MNRRIREAVVNFVDQNRLLILMVFSLILFFILICRLFLLQIIQGEEHLENFTYKIQRTVTTNGIRGNIYDANGELLAYNKLAYAVTFQNDSAFATLAKENKTTQNEERNKVIYRVIKILESNGDDIVSDFPIKRTGNGKFEFTVSGSELTTFKRNAYGIGTSTSDLSKEELETREKQLNATAEEMYQFFKDGTGGDAGTGDMFGISDEYSEEDALKIMAVRYNVYLSRFSQYMKVTIANEVSEDSIAAIEEASDELTGIDITENTMRVYNNSESIAHIIGYTGLASEDELETLNEGKEEDDPDSVLNFYRRLLKVRKGLPAVIYGSTEFLEMDDPELMVYIRRAEGQELISINNFSGSERSYRLPAGYEAAELLISNCGDPIIKDGVIDLRPWEAVTLIANC